MDLFDVEAIEAAESQINQFIERRAREARDQERVEEAWKESERRHRERQREENRELWRCYYLDQAERLVGRRVIKGGGCVVNGPMRRN